MPKNPFPLQTLFIPGVLALTIVVGWRILQQPSPSAPSSEHHGSDEHAGHAHEAAGHVELSPEQLQHANLTIEEARAAKIKTSLSLYGKIEANGDALVHVVPRFPGVLKEVHKGLGDTVEKGQLLALVESNLSLRTYEIRAEIPGTIIEKDATRGEFVRDDKTIFTIADLSSVWVNLSVFRQDFHLLKKGQAVMVHPGDGVETIAGRVDYISPFGAETTQTMLARCVIPNPQGDLRPGLFVTAEIVTGEAEAPVTVRAEAVQSLKEEQVVFVVEGDGFEARPTKLGAQDGERVAVLAGVKAGDKYVAGNSFLLKAHLGKEEGEHEH